MALFKKKKVEKKIEKKVEKKIEPKKTGSAWSSLISPHVTEKATGLEGQNKYIFKVFDRSNKTEIKKAVESIYGINVEEVNIINVPKKKRRVGKKNEGWKAGYKKAIVKVKEGQKIEILPR
jgi:large subunit ribosomal protein L23